MKDHEIAALVNSLTHVAAVYHDSQQLRERMREALLAEIQAAQAQQPSAQEPVGHLNVSRFRGSNAMVNTDFDYSGNLPDGNYQLYTRPAPQRKPLTDEQLIKIIRKGSYCNYPDEDDLVKLVREVEAAIMKGGSNA